MIISISQTYNLGFKSQQYAALFVINHYVSNNSNAYICLLDASNAFDKLHFGKLFHILLNRKV